MLNFYFYYYFSTNKLSSNELIRNVDLSDFYEIWPK